MKKLFRGLEKWGHYLLAGLCAGVILLSALWTREQWAMETPESQALADQSQRLSDGTPPPALPALVRPVEGPVLVSYADAPVYAAQTGVWQAHPWVDFAAANGDPVRAMLPGVVLSCGGEVVLDHGNGLISRYQGLGSVSVRVGQTVQAGGVLGAAAGPDESAVIRVSLRQNGGNVALAFD